MKFKLGQRDLLIRFATRQVKFVCLEAIGQFFMELTVPLILRFALLIDICSIWLEACFPNLKSFWPFSLDHVMRIALLLLAAAILIELWAIIQDTKKKLRHSKNFNMVEDDSER